MTETKSPAEQAACILRGLEDNMRELDAHGRHYETLGDDMLDVLRRAAAGERVAPGRVRIALRAGEKIRHQLSWKVLAIPLQPPW